jgi:glyoxylase-like metal-dependent hydrolase (beta-lactamase superfamily II)
MKIHAIQTGAVALTSAWREGVGHGRRRLLHAIVDRKWTEPLPINAFAIEHPEGVIVVDTGEDARASERSYFARWHPGLRAFREWVEPEQEIGPQLERLGIRPADVRWVVLTHLHTDTLAGCTTFPTTKSSSPAPSSSTRRACAAACAATSRTSSGQAGSTQPCSSSSRSRSGRFRTVCV